MLRILHGGAVALFGIAAALAVAWAAGAMARSLAVTDRVEKAGAPVRSDPPPLTTSQEFTLWRPRADLFGEPSPPASAPAAAAVTLSRLAARYRLAGILLGEARQAVLTDLATQQTLHVTEGQLLEGGIVVQSIEAHSIVLGFGEESLELRL